MDKNKLIELNELNQEITQLEYTINELEEILGPGESLGGLTTAIKIYFDDDEYIIVPNIDNVVSHILAVALPFYRQALSERKVKFEAS